MKQLLSILPRMPTICMSSITTRISTMKSIQLMYLLSTLQRRRPQLPSHTTRHTRLIRAIIKIHICLFLHYLSEVYIKKINTITYYKLKPAFFFILIDGDVMNRCVFFNIGNYSIVQIKLYLLNSKFNLFNISHCCSD